MPTDLKPSTAPSASALGGTELIPCTQSGASKALTPTQLKTYLGNPIGGSAGTVDNGILRADGTSGSTAQAGAPFVISDAGVLGVGGETSSFAGLYDLGSAKLGIVKANLGGYTTAIASDFQTPDNTTPKVILDSQVQLSSDSMMVWHNTTNARTGSTDLGINRVTVNVGSVTNGATSAAGWLQWAGQSYLAADATNATSTLASVGILVTLISGRKYAFKLILYVSDSVAAEGVKVDFGAGSAAATNFRAHVTGFDTALTLNTQVTSLTTAASAGTFTGSGMIEVHGSIEPSSSGTFGPRFAQVSHAAGTITAFRGSHILAWDMP